MIGNRKRFWRVGAGFALALLLVLAVLAPFGASMAGDGGIGGGIPIVGGDSGGINCVTPDTSTVPDYSSVIVSPWLIWLL
jgi:hypothetical protein